MEAKGIIDHFSSEIEPFIRTSRQFRGVVGTPFTEDEELDRLYIFKSGIPNTGDSLDRSIDRLPFAFHRFRLVLRPPAPAPAPSASSSS
jgi:hypothetical protein